MHAASANLLEIGHPLRMLGGTVAEAETARATLSTGLLHGCARSPQGRLVRPFDRSIMEHVNERRFLSAADAAEVLGVEPRDVVELVDSGALPGIRVANGWRIELDVLQSWIDEQYEQQRRHALWQESQSASIADLFGPGHR
jgi:excisionase family DNA binding protein